MEYAKSGRSTCRGCEEKIAKGEVRISKKDFDGLKAKMYGPQDLWHHVDCFVEKREELGFTTDLNPKDINGFKSLSDCDKELVTNKLGKGKGKKRKAEEASVETKKVKTAETDEDKALKTQSQLMWKLRDSLSKEVPNDVKKSLLSNNNQDIPVGESRVIDALTDVMFFGALKPCAECGGQLKYSSGRGYRCTGDATEWTKCQAVVEKPPRKLFLIDAEYKDIPCLKKYKYVKRDRVFPAVTEVSMSGAGDAGGNKPLNGMKFVFIGKMEKPRKEVTRAITEMGGNVVTKVDKKTAACISSKAEVEKNSKLMKEAKDSDIQVVDVGFVEAVKKGGAALLIKQHSICSWGSEPLDRLGDVVDGPMKSVSTKRKEKEDTQAVCSVDCLSQSLPRETDCSLHTAPITPKGSGSNGCQQKKLFTKSVPSTMKMTVKGGAAVDPDSGLEDKAHVLKVKDELYNAVLGLVDLVRGTNSYYKFQLLESDATKRWWLFRSWGRVGTTIGGEKTEVFYSRDNAIEAFKDLYADKTGNLWKDRAHFQKYPKKFYPLDIDYGADAEVKRLDENAGSNSNLSKPVQELIRMIFDVDSMKRAMLEFEIDLKKMPLGKLSKKQIESAYKVLSELQQLIEKGGTPTQFLDASNRFYTLIPHDFGMKKPPVLSSTETIKMKTEMLQNLLDFEIAYSMLTAGDESTKDPIDLHYEKLKTDLQPLDKESEEYKRLTEYVANTHASTHNQYGLNVQEIFKVEREGERKRYKPFKALNNRQLLWHGSGTANYAGILLQGLRIAPPEAPVTGYMFGKGVYFADMVSKSANYCRVNKSSPVGLLMLCEVALGNMYELTQSKYVDKLPKGKHSTKGCGRTGPDAAENN
ncbi:Poly [ADP-ribose] polymerase 1 [Lamellibrachia satsuma]|nr:Poly [ADP-ribose] polymerase 1 [Lamellibrachia satsuma]